MTVHKLHIRQWPGIFLCLLALLGASGATVPLTSNPQADLTALVRVDLPTVQASNELAALVFPIYAQLYTAGEGSFLLLPATTELQTELTNLGYAPRVLDTDTSQASYYLLYGTAKALKQVGSPAVILWAEGRQAVARLTPAQAEQLAQARLHLQALHLHPWLAASARQAPESLTAVTPDPMVQSMISQVSLDTLYNYVGDLSGEWPITIEGAAYTLHTRYTRKYTDLQKATRFAYEHFQALGLPVDYDYYTLSGEEKRNVIAEQVGASQPDQIYLITAHLDSTSNLPTVQAPGADDNASGSVGVLVAADILSKYQFDYTLRYVLFTGEEQGLYGSEAYAQQAHDLGETIVGVLNLDMIAYNTPNTASTIELHTRPGNASDLTIANLFTQVISAYNIDLQPTILQDGIIYSDHSSFWDQGYPAILAIEDLADETPYYHTTSDRLSTLHMTYFKNFVQASLATLVHMNRALQGQVHGFIRDAESDLPLAGATVTASQATESYGSTTSQANGEYTLYLSPGSYNVEAAANSYYAANAPDISVAEGITTTQNLFLQPCAMVQGMNFVSTPFLADPGEIITFTAAATATLPLTYQWNFGDGTSGSGQVITHSFAANRTYTVQLTIGNACTPTWLQKNVYVTSFPVYLPMVTMAIY